MTRLFFKKLKIFFSTNSYGLLRTLKENKGKWKKIASIMDCHGLA